MSGLGDRFTKTPYSVKPLLDALKLQGKIAHLTMFETVVSECHGRKKPNWTVTTRKLVARLVTDTGRISAPHIRRSQVVIRELEEMGLLRRYCARSGALISQLGKNERKNALSHPLGVHYKIAGFDYEAPSVDNLTTERRGSITQDRSVGADPADRQTIGGGRSPDDRPKEDGSLDQTPPLPPSRRTPRRLRLVGGSEDEESGYDPEAISAQGFRGDPRVPKLLERVNRVHEDRGCHQVRGRELMKALTKASERHSKLKDMVQIFTDIFVRYSEDIPTRLKSGPVRNPLLLVASWSNLGDYVRTPPPRFPDPPPRETTMTPEEHRRRLEDTRRLFESM